MNITTVMLGKQNSAEAQSLVCNDFFQNSCLHQAVAMKQSEFEQYISKSWHIGLDSCPVPALAAVDISSSQVVGCIVPATFPSDFSNIEALSPKRRSIALLLQALESMYIQRNPSTGKTLLVDIAVVSTAAVGQGVYQRMRQEIQILAKQAGFRHIAGALSSAATQRVCVEKFNQQIVAEISFAKYKEGTFFPFRSITEPKSIQLVIGDL